MRKVDIRYYDQVIEMIEGNSLPSGIEFEMGNFHRATECGTACCLHGTAYYLQHGEHTAGSDSFPKVTDLFSAWLIDLFWKIDYSAKEVVARYKEIVQYKSMPLRGADLRGADLTSVNLAGADLVGTNLKVADLSCADLSCADLTGANLTGANLKVADLSDADLSDADLTGVDLSDTNLTGANLAGAIYNKRTEFPIRFYPEDHGLVLRV